MASKDKKSRDKPMVVAATPRTERPKPVIVAGNFIVTYFEDHYDDRGKKTEVNMESSTCFHAQSTLAKGATGLFAMRKIKKDELFLRYVGDVITTEQAAAMKKNAYIMELKHGKCVDAKMWTEKPKLSLARYINSPFVAPCDRGTIKRYANAQFMDPDDKATFVEVAALRDIEVGEEIFALYTDVPDYPFLYPNPLYDSLVGKTDKESKEMVEALIRKENKRYGVNRDDSELGSPDSFVTEIVDTDSEKEEGGGDDDDIVALLGYVSQPSNTAPTTTTTTTTTTAATTASIVYAKKLEESVVSASRKIKKLETELRESRERELRRGFFIQDADIPENIKPIIERSRKRTYEEMTVRRTSLRNTSTYAAIEEIAALLTSGNIEVVVFTGAGISHGAGMPLYRSKEESLYRSMELKEVPTFPRLSDIDPSIAHKIVKFMMVDLGMIQKVVTTNVDGLHVKSGIPADQLAEIHGSRFWKQCLNNDYREKPESGDKRKCPLYRRPLSCPIDVVEYAAQSIEDVKVRLVHSALIGLPDYGNLHIEGDVCEKCGKEEMYTCVAVAMHGNKKNAKTKPKGYTSSIRTELFAAMQWTKKADLILVCGMSQEVSTCMDMFKEMKAGCQMAVFNLERPMEEAMKSRMTWFVEGDVQVTIPLLLAQCLTVTAINKSKQAP